MDFKPFEKLSYGLHIITTRSGEKVSGCVVNTMIQATAEPPKMVVIINNDNQTTKLIKESGVFAGVTLAESATMELIGAFGFHCSADYDKFSPFATAEDDNGVPYLTEQTTARFSCKVVSQTDAGSHTIFLAEIQQAELISDEPSMTYAYYHQIKKGLTPPKASSYRPEPAIKGYRCTVCGYVLESDTLPPDFICPICHKGSEVFVPVE